MDRLILIKPTIDREREAQEYIDEHIAHGETDLHGAALLEKMTYPEWIDLLQRNSSEATVPSDWVVASTFFVVRERDYQIVGTVDIRHHLNDFLENYGGHIGYGVRPHERGKGYATEILKMALSFCRRLGLTQVMLACNKSNVASRKTIITNGGVLKREFMHDDGNMVQVFWIDLMTP